MTITPGTTEGSSAATYINGALLGHNLDPTVIPAAASAAWSLSTNRLFTLTPNVTTELQIPEGLVKGATGRIYVVANAQTVTFAAGFSVVGGGELPADGVTDCVIYFDVVDDDPVKILLSIVEVG